MSASKDQLQAELDALKRTKNSTIPPKPEPPRNISKREPTFMVWVVAVIMLVEIVYTIGAMI